MQTDLQRVVERGQGESLQVKYFIVVDIFTASVSFWIQFLEALFSSIVNGQSEREWQYFCVDISCDRAILKPPVF